MTIKTRLKQLDEETANLWHFQLYGPDSVNETIRLAVTSQQLSSSETPEDWISSNLATAQSLVDGGITNLFTAKQEAKEFLAANPAARNLLELGPTDLETAINNRTAGQETLLLKALSYGIRIVNAALKEE